MPAYRTRGHAAALEAVERAVAAERPPHALLLVGPASVGKTTLALDLSRGLLCLADPGARPCGSCVACRKVDHGNHPDLHRLSPDGAGGQVRLQQVHELQSELSLLAMEGRFRIAIVEAAHRLNPDAQNALLKTLEEPPPRVVIVLCADDEGPLLPTVHSRCARLRLAPVGVAVIVELLKQGGLAEPPQAGLVARLSEGRPGLALALAADPDAVIAWQRLSRTLLDLVAADRVARLSSTSDLLADGMRLVQALERTRDAMAGDEAPVADGARRLSQRRAGGARGAVRAGPPPPAERRTAVLQVLAAWRGVARELAIVGVGGRREIRQVDLLEEIEGIGKQLDAGALAAFLGRLDALATAVESYANPELALDVLLLSWPRPESAPAPM